jgi:NADH dehydrogenase [ubiquinone] 1 alpha subcomplex assembly factor 7
MLNALLRKEIREQGPLSQDRFMELALQHPTYGYYRTHQAIGRDFTTAPEVSQMFGELVCAWAMDYYERLGSPKLMTLVELGPGKGTLMADFLRVARTSPSFLQSLQLHLIEINPLLKKMQQETIRHPSALWHENFEDIPPSTHPLIIIANEFFDALPTKCYVRKENMLHERHIGMKNDHLAFVLTPLHEDMGADQIWETSPRAETLMRNIMARLSHQTGAFLFFDYGYEAGQGESLQALFQGSPSPTLSHIGHSDLTCHVNFGRLKQLALSQELGVLGPLSQGQFLKNMGLDLRAEKLKHLHPAHSASFEAAVTRLTHPQQMGTLFKAMAVFSPPPLKPAGFDV